MKSYKIRKSLANFWGTVKKPIQLLSALCIFIMVLAPFSKIISNNELSSETIIIPLIMGIALIVFGLRTVFGRFSSFSRIIVYNTALFIFYIVYLQYLDIQSIDDINSSLKSLCNAIETLWGNNINPFIHNLVLWVRHELIIIIPLLLIILGILLFITIRLKGIGKWRDVGSWDFNFVYGPDRTIFSGNIPKEIKAKIPIKGFSAGIYKGKMARHAWEPVTHTFRLGHWEYRVVFRWGDSSCYGYVYKRPTILTRINWILRHKKSKG